MPRNLAAGIRRVLSARELAVNLASSRKSIVRRALATTAMAGHCRRLRSVAPVKEPCKEIIIDFREDDFRELADAMKEDFDAGMSVDEILEKHGRSYAVYAKAIKHWHNGRGLTTPDGRTLRGRLKGRRTSDKRSREDPATLLPGHVDHSDR
jgi:hypothetical protein